MALIEVELINQNITNVDADLLINVSVIYILMLDHDGFYFIF
jgi:hypothetical protein